MAYRWYVFYITSFLFLLMLTLCLVHIFFLVIITNTRVTQLTTTTTTINHHHKIQRPNKFNATNIHFIPPNSLTQNQTQLYTFKLSVSNQPQLFYFQTNSFRPTTIIHPQIFGFRPTITILIPIQRPDHYYSFSNHWSQINIMYLFYNHWPQTSNNLLTSKLTISISNLWSVSNQQLSTNIQHITGNCIELLIIPLTTANSAYLPFTVYYFIMNLNVNLRIISIVYYELGITRLLSVLID